MGTVNNVILKHSEIRLKVSAKLFFCSLDVILDLFEFHKGSAMDFKKSGGTPGVPRNYFAARD